MKNGDIVLLPFPFAELTNRKVRPAVVVCETKDKYKDIVVCAVSSVVPTVPGQNEILLHPDKVNNLRADSVIKVDRIVTVKRHDVITQIGKLDAANKAAFNNKFKQLTD